tara:strand:- start:6582 stop:7265 length:684 start_codon:yes stop_codon:yes gene_type:complete
MGRSTLVKQKTDIATAVEVLAKNINMSYEQVANEVGVSKNTINNWMSNPEFIERVYERYMQVAGAQLPYVVQAMIEEARLGNVHASKLILEHFGKLEQKLHVKVESNFEKFISSVNAEEADFFDITNEQTEVLDAIEQHIGDVEIEVPERHPSNDKPKLRDAYEKARLKGKVKSKMKDLSEKDKQAERYLIRKRAKKVGLEMLPPGRHSKSVKNEWLEKLEKLENEK